MAPIARMTSDRAAYTVRLSLANGNTSQWIAASPYRSCFCIGNLSVPSQWQIEGQLPNGQTVVLGTYEPGNLFQVTMPRYITINAMCGLPIRFVAATPPSNAELWVVFKSGGPSPPACPSQVSGGDPHRPFSPSTIRNPFMGVKLGALLLSRRFWFVVLGLLLIGWLPIELRLFAVILVSAWIIGDSIRATWVVLIATGLALAPIAFAGDLHDHCREATVRIRNGTSMGSGTVFRQSADSVYVLTNAHVAGTRLGNQVEVEFWREGHQSKPVAGETVAVAYIPRAYRDIAVVRVAKQSLGTYVPPVVPLAGAQDSVSYHNLYSVGCPSGRWPTAFQGFALTRQTDGGDTIHFVPMPAGGRSGSALFDVGGRGPRIIGLIAWRSSDEGGHGLDGRGETHGYGIAMTHQEVWAGLSGKPTTSSVLLVPPPNAVPLEHVVPKSTVPQQSVLESPKPPSEPKEATPDAASNEPVFQFSDPWAVTSDDKAIPLQSIPTDVPPTGSPRDVMLYYSDAAGCDGPQNTPPPLVCDGCCPYCQCPYCNRGMTTTQNCPGGRCPLPQDSPGQRDPLFPSWRGEPPFNEEFTIPSPWSLIAGRLLLSLLPWLLLIAIGIGTLVVWWRTKAQVTFPQPIIDAPPPQPIRRQARKQQAPPTQPTATRKRASAQ